MIRRLAGARILVAFLSVSSGCALFLVGAAGTGGYLIRKGEKGGGSGSAKKASSDSHSKTSSKKTAEEKGSSSTSSTSSPSTSDQHAMKKRFSLLVVLSLLIGLAGCATLRGMGEDIQNLGKGRKKTVSE
jgi:predicted small secreted protein